MSEEIYDGVAEIKKKILAKWAGPGEKARAASDAGKLKLVSEHEIVPHKGIGFTLDKGQVLRYELTHGPQVIDTTYLVRNRPVEEFADCYPELKSMNLVDFVMAGRPGMVTGAVGTKA